MSENIKDINLSNPIEIKRKKYIAKALKEFNECIESCNYKDYEKEDMVLKIFQKLEMKLDKLNESN